MTNILGIYSWIEAMNHDNWAVLISWDNIVWISSERLDRIKKSSWYLIKEVKWKKIAYSFDSCEAAVSYCLDYFNVVKIDLLVYLEWDKKYLIEKYNPKKIICLWSHHLAHWCSSYLASTFDESALLIMDWRGFNYVEWWGCYPVIQSIYKWVDNDITRLKETTYNWKRKIGIWWAYRYITEKLMWLESEGILMWLSSYWKHNSKFDYFTFLKKYDGHMYLNDIFLEWVSEEELEFLSNEILYNFFWYTEKEIELMKEDIVNSELSDIAYKLQKEVEEAIINLANEAYDLTQSKNLCISWWVWLNCIANKLILDNTPFENIFISPPVNDSWLALWCALFWKNIINNDTDRFEMKDAFMWKEYSDEEINLVFEKYKKNISNISLESNIYKVSADLLSKWKVIWWYHGWSEIWPRALWHRSIIWDPRSIEIRDKVNDIKNRERWRPLAPVILEEDVSEYFDINYPSRFMLLIANAKDKAIKETPWIVHIDKTARIQTVTEESSKEFYYLLKEFKNITNIWVLINTSFNLAWEPIIETPEEAIKSFLSSKLDYLVINNYLISKKRVFNEFEFKLISKNKLVSKNPYVENSWCYNIEKNISSVNKEINIELLKSSKVKEINIDKINNNDIHWIILEYTNELNSWNDSNLELMKKNLIKLHLFDKNNLVVLRFFWRILCSLNDKESELKYAEIANNLTNWEDWWFLYDLWRINFELWNIEKWKLFINESVKKNNNLAKEYLKKHIKS